MVDFPFDYKAFAALMSGVVDSFEHRAQIGHHYGANLALGRAEGPANTTSYQADRLLLGRTVVPRGPMGGTDRGQAKVYRHGLGVLGKVGHVQGHGLRAGGQGHHRVRGVSVRLPGVVPSVSTSSKWVTSCSGESGANTTIRELDLRLVASRNSPCSSSSSRRRRALPSANSRCSDRTTRRQNAGPLACAVS